MGTLPGLELCVLQTAKVLDSLAALGRALARHHLATQSFPHVDSHHLRVEEPRVEAAPGGGGGRVSLQRLKGLWEPTVLSPPGLHAAGRAMGSVSCSLSSVDSGSAEPRAVLL